MQINCPHCCAACEVDFEPDIGQHVLCPFCNTKFSYGVSEDPTPRTVMAVCPYCGFAEAVDEQYSGHVGVCSQCQKEFTIMPNARGIPFQPQAESVQSWFGGNDDSTSEQSTVREDALFSAILQLNPKRWVKLLRGVGIALGGLFIFTASGEFLFWSVFLMIAAACAPKFGAISNPKRFIRYLATCAVLAFAIRGGCYGLHLSQIHKDKQSVAMKNAKVADRVQELAKQYFGHELCEWYPKDADESEIAMQGTNPFAFLQGGDAVKKDCVVSDCDGCLFELRAELCRQTKLSNEISQDFAEAKVVQFRNSDLIAKLTKTLGEAPDFVCYPTLPGELVNLNAEYDSDERTEDGKPLVLVKVSYSLSSGRLLASQLGRDSDAGYSDRESWSFEIHYNGH